MNSVQLTLAFMETPCRAVQGTVAPIVVPSGFRLLSAYEPLKEGDKVWLPNEYAPNRSPWVEVIVLHDGNSMRDTHAIRRCN